MMILKRLWRFVVGTAALMATAVPVSADVLILDPGNTGLRIGTVLGDRQRLTIAAGSKVALVLPSGDTRTVTGPFDAPVSSLTATTTRNAAAWARWLKDLGAPEPNERSVGGTRGGTR